MAETLRNRDLAWIAAPIVLLILSPVAVPALDPAASLEAAIHREIVIGDLKGAIGQYRQILATAAVPRTVAARAAFRLGECLEKTGRRVEARDAYATAANQYGDQTEVAAQARALLANWEYSGPGPVNLRFKEGVPGKLPPGWFVPALPQEAGRWAQLRRGAECRSGQSCAVVMVPDHAPLPASDLRQSFSAVAFRGKKLLLRAWLRLEKVDPADRAQMWLSVNREGGRTGAFDDMSGRPIRSAAWTMAEIRALVDEDADSIQFGVMSAGKGRVWVDDVTLEVSPVEKEN